MPVELGKQGRGGREFGSGLVARGDHRHLRKHEAGFVADGAEHMDGRPRCINRLPRQPPAPCLAVYRDCRPSLWQQGVVPCIRAGEAGGKQVRIEAGEQAVQRGLVRHAFAREAESATDALVLRRSPLGHCQDRQVVGKNGGDGKREQRGEGEVPPLGATRVGQSGERGVQQGKTDSGGDGGCILHMALLVADQASDTCILPSGAFFLSTHKPCPSSGL